MGSIERAIIHELGNKVSYLKAYVETNADKFDEEFISLVSNLDIITRYLVDTTMGKDKSLTHVVTNLGNLLLDVKDELLFFAESRKISIRIKRCEQVNIKSDPFLLSRVLFNLLHNAIKFSPQSSEVVVECHTDINGSKIEILNKVDSENLKENKGTGVGLKLSEKIIESLGGSLEFLLKGDKAIATITLPSNLT